MGNDVSSAPTSLGWAVFADGMHQNALRDRLEEGVKALVELYYREYTQADELDPDFYRQLSTVLGSLCDLSIDSEWLHTLINQVQDSLKGTLDCDGQVRPAFKRLPVDEDTD